VGLILCEMWGHGVVIPTERRDSDSLRERTILFLGKVRPLAVGAILSSLRLSKTIGLSFIIIIINARDLLG